MLGILIPAIGAILVALITLKGDRNTTQWNSLPALADQLQDALENLKIANERVIELESQISELTQKNKQLTIQVEELLKKMEA